MPIPESTENRLSPARAEIDAAGADAGMAALGEMFEAHSERVFRAAHRITGNAMDAEDVLQTVFLRLARRDLKGGDPLVGDEAVGYFYRSAVNAALDIVRSRQRAGWAPLEAAERASESAAVVEGGRGREFEPEREHRLKGLRRALRLAISRLSPRSAEIFTLRYFEGLSYQRIAEVIGSSPGLVAVLLHRTRARLKKELSTLGHAAGELS